VEPAFDAADPGEQTDDSARDDPTLNRLTGHLRLLL
jgi:hypothetical protein